MQSINTQEEFLSREYQLESMFLQNRLPDPDPILNRSGLTNQIYREHLIDGHLSAVFQKRKSGLLSMQWELDTRKTPSRVAKFFKDYFDNHVNVYNISKKVLDCLYYGYQPFLLKYKLVGGYYVPTVEDRPQEYFYYNQKNELLIRQKNLFGNGIPIDPRQIIVARNNPDYLNPYGEKIANKTFWWVTFKKGNVKLWLKFLEKYGMPTVVGKVPPTTSLKGRHDLLSSLTRFVADGVLVVNDNENIELLDASGKSSSSDGYDRFKSACNYEISKAVLTVANTVEIGDVGSRAATDTQYAGEGKLNLDDKKIVESFFNDLIKIIYQINFTNGAPPQLFFYNEENIDTSLSNRDKTLVDMGVRFSKDYYKKSYNLVDEDFELFDPNSSQLLDTVIHPNSGLDESTTDKQKTEFSESVKVDVIANIMDAVPEKLLQLQMEKLLNPVIDAVNNGKSFSEITDNLASMYPKLSSSQLEELLSKALFIAQIEGHQNAK